MLFYIFDVFFHDKKILSVVLPPITQHTTLCIIYSANTEFLRCKNSEENNENTAARFYCDVHIDSRICRRVLILSCSKFLNAFPI